MLIPRDYILSQTSNLVNVLSTSEARWVCRPHFKSNLGGSMFYSGIKLKMINFVKLYKLPLKLSPADYYEKVQ